MTLWHALGVFCAAFATDFLWSRYIQAVSSGRRSAAALWSGAVIACGGMVTLAYVADWRFLPVCCLGGATGTYVAMWRKGKRCGTAAT